MRIKRKKYEQASNGWHNAVCADVIDLGIQKTRFGNKEQIRLVFLIDERDATGEPIQVFDTMTASTWETSKLTEYTRALTGAVPPDDFDPDQLIGRTCRLETEQQTSDKGKTYANIVRKAPMKAGEHAPGIPLNYVRAKDRPPSGKFRTNGGLGATKPNIHGVHVRDEDVLN